MVPVELRLSNFLSYGETPRTLDFSRFHVACLSGKNGQGKSALLDAITWALWGEARKSSGGHKPDDELIRLGTRRMTVEFVFEAEQDIYRVMRTYSRSASGKTSKVELELQVLPEPGAEGRPLTGASIRETQEHLIRILGLDYQTFINSAFLLQGRSDEFTKKKPGDRKEILGRILNLSKYDRLAMMARDRQRKLAGEIDVLDREIERLSISLENEDTWKSRLVEVVAELEERNKGRDLLREQIAAISEELGALESQQKEADSLKDQISRLQVQTDEEKEEIDRLIEQITKARRLLEQKGQIETDYEQYEVLVQERDDLDTKRDVVRGLERQREQKNQELIGKRRELEQKVHHLELQRQVSRDSLSDVLRNREDKASIEESLLRATAAQARMEHRRKQELQHRALLEEKKNAELRLAGEREKLVAQQKSLLEQLASMDAKLAVVEDLRRRCRELEARKQAMAQLSEKLHLAMESGMHIAEEIKQKEGGRQALEIEKVKLIERLDRLRAVDESVCPTCGSELTDSHRLEVEGQLTIELEELVERIGALQGEIEAQSTERDALREKYRGLKQQEDAGASVLEDLARLQEQAASMDRLESEKKGLAEQEARLKKQLADENYAASERESLRGIDAKLVELGFDEAGAQKDAFEAAQCERYEEKLRQCLMEEGKIERLQAQLTSLDGQIEGLRLQLDTGEPFKDIQAGITVVDEKIRDLGFDHGRFEVVRVQLKGLSGAHERMRDLLHAEKNLEDWRIRREQLEKRNAEAVEELSGGRDKLKQLNVRLQEREDVRKKLTETSARRESVEQEIQKMQVQQGELQGRLAQAEQDRSALKEARKNRKELRRHESQYGKLRRAFGKNGIPSLIIEQTLPEIEARTNELLDRLTEGKMRVRLETLKDKKTGGTRETLEIIIADEQGVPRPYETFSGGEAFRVNFALRIALSQLLAARNGVRIRTLGIDEGFGTQDEEGIQSLIEAIKVIQDDFDKILVITHLDRLKEAFPVRIEVEKDPVEGSNFMLIEG